MNERRRRRVVYYGSDFQISRSEAIDAWNESLSIRGSAKAIGCSYGTAVRILNFFGIDTGHRGRPQVEIQKEDLEMYVEGFSWKQIADAFEVSVNTIRSEFKRHGLEKRDERSKNDWIPCDLD